MKRKWRIIYIILGGVAAILVFLYGKYKYEHTYSARRWAGYPQERVNMVDDMIRKHELIGMSREEVRKLLGKEMEDAYYKAEDNVVYYLGDERALISIDSEWLVITFEDDVVVQVEIKTD